jgi:hypothetical protein
MKSDRSVLLVMRRLVVQPFLGNRKSNSRKKAQKAQKRGGKNLTQRAERERPALSFSTSSKQASIEHVEG